MYALHCSSYSKCNWLLKLNNQWIKFKFTPSEIHFQPLVKKVSSEPVSIHSSLCVCISMFSAWSWRRSTRTCMDKYSIRPSHGGRVPACALQLMYWVPMPGVIHASQCNSRSQRSMGKGEVVYCLVSASLPTSICSKANSAFSKWICSPGPASCHASWSHSPRSSVYLQRTTAGRQCARAMIVVDCCGTVSLRCCNTQRQWHSVNLWNVQPKSPHCRLFVFLVHS